MSETTTMGEINGDICIFHKSENIVRFALYISLSEKFLLLTPNGTPIESGSVTKNSCCLRCDSHESDYETKQEKWKSIKCLKANNENEWIQRTKDSYTLTEELEFIFTSTVVNPTRLELDICPQCYEEVKSTGQMAKNEKSAELTSSFL